jgi:hypothetical protein
MYIFVFYWSAAMKSAHANSTHTADNRAAAEIPFGIIFATFMASMMLGSLGFTYISSTWSTLSRFSSIREFLSLSVLVALANAGAAVSLVVTVLRNEALTFWAFCFFEICTTTVEGDANRDFVFMCCAGLLLLSSLASIYFLKEEKTIETDSDLSDAADDRLE